MRIGWGNRIALGAFIVFLASPIAQIKDSRYTLLVSTSLLHHGTLRLDTWAPASCGGDGTRAISDRLPYQFWCRDGHAYSFFPLGTALLAVPYVALADLAGFSVVGADGRYQRKAEKHLQRFMAALLMAVLAQLFYMTARLVLPRSLSVWVAIGGAFGTQVWSTASRALWSHTFQLLLLGTVLWLMLRHGARERRLCPSLLATLLAWSYFVRPTSSISILACSVYLFRERSGFVPFLVTLALWMVLFVAASLCIYGSWLPPYYMASRLDLHGFWGALAGHLVSPARGVLVYVPLALFAGLLAASNARNLRPRYLAVVACAAIAAHLIVASAFPHWWGGHSYGPRLLTDTVPWLVLLGVLGFDAHRRGRADKVSEGSSPRLRPISRSVLIAGLIALALSVALNGVGATSFAAAKWNRTPTKGS